MLVPRTLNLKTTVWFGAIGARIKITLRRASGLRVLYRTVRSGGSWGASPLRQEIGLGQATAIQSVEVTWPVTGKTQIVTGLQMSRRYKMREGVPLARQEVRNRV